MSFKICNSLESFQLIRDHLKTISDHDHLHLTTHFTKKKGLDGRFVRWWKVVLSKFLKVQIAETAPLKVAQEVAKFAENYKTFLGISDRTQFIGFVERLRVKCKKQIKKRDEKKFDQIIARIKDLAVGHKEIYSITIPVSNCVNLPQEIFEKIMAYLPNGRDASNCNQVNSKWNATTRRVAFNELKKIEGVLESFIDFYIGSDNPESENVVSLIELKLQIAHLDPQNLSLSQIHEYIMQARGKILNVISTDKDISKLQSLLSELEISFPFRNILELAQLKVFIFTELKQTLWVNTSILEDINKILEKKNLHPCDLNHISEILDDLTFIPNSYNLKNQSKKIIAKFLAQNKYINEALSAICKIDPDFRYDEKLFAYIFNFIEEEHLLHITRIIFAEEPLTENQKKILENLFNVLAGKYQKINLNKFNLVI